MEKKTKKILAIVLSIVAILLIALIVLLVVLLPKKNNTPKHTEHTYVYTEESDTQHKKTCSGCTDVNELENHVWDNEQDTICNLCKYTRTIASAYPYSTSSGVKLTADKTELTAGDTFKLTVEIATNRVDTYWSSFDIIFSPLRSTGAIDSTIASYFEFVSLTTSLDNFGKDEVLINSVPRFTASQKQGYRISVSFLEHIPTVDTNNRITLEIVLKVKDDAPNVSSFDFGVSPKPYNYVSYLKEIGTKSEADRADSSDKITINKIQMIIAAKSN